MNVMDVVKPWESVNAALGLTGPVRDEAHYAALLAFVEECFDRFGGQESHPIFALVALVGDHIREYEARVRPWPDTTTPGALLAYLIEAHSLKQSDLPEVGPQSVVSEVLSGKRSLNLRQVQALATRFHVPMEMFAA
ncbi:MAG: transcriptional regulator [Pseudomonadota bacterium]|nr:transcriptional regulator [Pseudomonadota bacterium]